MEFEKIRDVIISEMGTSGGKIKKEMITPETTFDDLGADSLEIFQVILALEEMFGMEFDDSETENIKTVGDAAEFIRRALES